METREPKTLERHTFVAHDGLGKEGEILLVEGSEAHVMPFGVVVRNAGKRYAANVGRGFSSFEEAESLYRSLVAEQEATGDVPESTLLARGVVGLRGRAQVPERLLLEVDIDRTDGLMRCTLRLIRRVHEGGSNGSPVYTVEWYNEILLCDGEGIHVEEYRTLGDALKRFGEYVEIDEMWAFAQDYAEARLPGFNEQVEENDRARTEAIRAEEGDLPF